MKGEEEHCALPVLFAKSSSTSEYCKEVFVNVVYHNKTPQYHDEIKIKLPALLNGIYVYLLSFGKDIFRILQKAENFKENIFSKKVWNYLVNALKYLYIC